MKINYYFACTKCKKEISEMLEFDDIPQFLEDHKCEKCGSPLKKSWGVGGIQMKGKDFTKNYLG